MRYFLLLVFVVFIFATGVSAQIGLAERHFKQASELGNAREYRDAIESYEKSLQIAEASSGPALDSLIAKIHYNTGVCFYKLKEFSQAENHFTMAIVIDPVRDNKKHFALSLTQIDLGKFSDAKKTLRSVLRNDEKHGEAWFELGMIYLNEGSLSQAKEAFLTSANLESFRRSDAVNNFGVILAMEGDLRMAEAAFERAYLLSGKKLNAAKRNYEYCKRHSIYSLEKLVSNLMIANKKGVENGE